MRAIVCLAVVASVACSLTAEPPAAGHWKDPSKHEVRFLDVDEGVRLEVLDWGGSGPPIVLLAGYGHSAHVYDDFAPKLTDVGRVVGITRRGFGASTHPESGYDDQRLADDVLAVIEALRLEKPVLVGHSLGGSELTTLGNQHSDDLAGLVYLDALQDPRDFPSGSEEHMRLFRALPEAGPRCERKGDTIEAHREAQICNEGSAMPEAEWRNVHVVDADGTVGRHKSPSHVGRSIGDGQIKRDYSKIRVPVLALAELPRVLGVDPPHPDDYVPKNDEERAAIVAFNLNVKGYGDRWVASLKRAVPEARIVDVGPRAGHNVFRTREAKVLEEIRAFLARLRP